jgi:hypothetical protein
MVPLLRREVLNMLADMAERTRLIIDTEEDLRLAVHLAAGAAGMTKSQFVNAVLRKALANELKDVQKYLSKRKEKGGEE